jgi:hypothetical protein
MAIIAAADNEWSKYSPEERIEAVWTLTELCLAWNQLSDSEHRLQRSVTRLQRRHVQSVSESQ